jgi:hypothetical protein
MARLSGTGRLADDLYLLAHNDVNGKPHLQQRALGIGLAGGLLAELVLAGKIGLKQGTVAVVDSTAADDGLTRSVQEALEQEREQHPVRTWLQFLGASAAPDVARRLEQAGYLTQVRGRRGPRWIPVDADCAFAPLVRVRAALDATRPPSIHGAALTGLASACGLSFRLARATPPGPSRSVEEVLGHLDADMRELIAQTQVAVDTALLSHRL